MLAYIVRRSVHSLIVCVGVTFLTFALTLRLPGDPAVAIAGPKASPEVLARIRHELGLDRPILVQYAKYVGRLLQGDFGRSYVTGTKVSAELLDRLPATAYLGGVAWLCGAVLGILGGSLGALYPRANTWVFAATVVGFAVPPFWLGLLLLYVFAYVLPVFPLGGFSPGGVVLPAAALALGLAASYARLVSAQLADILRQDFIRTARAKGLSRTRIVLGHALRNALLPLVTLLGLDLAGFLGGVTLTETVFNWPGLGRLAVEAVFNQDIPMLMGTVLLGTLLVVTINWIVDVSYAWIDPRVREG